ncbi:MAG: sodium-dependent transporter [Xanthomonadales bacterium]|nr:sodium-dependent transporter [Gammaproteobacteria bacterium]MBT8053916.1 sodium-dependent transporter [Gammaproteobacteria bacterium]NND58257.1 sodium-dependent transporter [Xanthomonadales bacterium]NNK52032.1 sodium-dependent transporter [Xanthomonadales bacterium]
MATIHKKHENWSSRFTFLLAAVGAAVGLGNIWKFPYVTGQNGGSAFVLVYFLAVAFVALPILIAEIAVGRWGRQSPPNAMMNVARGQGRSGAWSLVGWFGMLAAYMIATYYSVIAGWSVVYIFKNGGGNFEGQSAAVVSAEFDALLADPLQLGLWHGIFMLICTFILARGLQKGIESTVKILMPALFALLLAMVVYGIAEGNMPKALHFMFDFDLSAISGKMILMAVGQAFFSIGVAMGLMMGFGAYLPREVSIARSAVIIAGMDTMVAIIAGLAIFPIVFANGLDPAEGPGLIFVSLPLAFGSVTGGLIFGTLFFILLFFAALTSVIATVEPMIAWVEERFRMGRRKSAITVCLSILILGMGTVFSFNLWSEWRPLAAFERYADFGYFEIIDYLTANIMMPLGGLLLAIFVGWRVKPEAIEKELQIKNRALFRAWFWLLRWVAPVSIALILASGL